MSTEQTHETNRPSHAPDPSDVATAKTCILRRLGGQVGDGIRLSDFENQIDVDQKAVVVAVEELQADGLVATEAIVCPTSTTLDGGDL